MLENIKFDIIYHLTPSDFEMEFNLGGCCRMRLLTDKTQDRKGLVNALAKAVSRSQVIMACGPLFSNTGLISVTATALGKKLVPANKAAYGINAEGQIPIIDGSIPLVTPDGYFGGCIIESGPQTLILVTENRTFRKIIMKTLIHPYIEELSMLPLRQQSSRFVAPATPVTESVAAEENNPDEAPIVAEAEVDATETPDTIATKPAAEVAIPTPGEHNIEFIMDGTGAEEVSEDVYAVDPVFNAMLTEVDKDSYEYDDSYISLAENDLYVSQDDTPSKASAKRVNLLITILCVLLFAAVLTLCYFVFLKPYLMGISITEYLNRIFGDATTTTLSFWRKI